MTNNRCQRAAIVLLLAVFAVSGIAAVVPAHAQEQAHALFSSIPEGV